MIIAAHRNAGLVVVQFTQLHGAVQVEVMGICCEAKHVEAVADGGVLPITSRLSLGYIKEGNRLVLHTPVMREATGCEEFIVHVPKTTKREVLTHSAAESEQIPL